MSKFKVGDKVKTQFGIGKIVEIDKSTIRPYLVYHDTWSCGHNAKPHFLEKYSGNHCWWFEEYELKLVEPTITSEININSSGAEVMISNPITNKYEDLLETLEKGKENYRNWFMGIWEKDNPIIEKKEGNDMLESLNLVDLYASKQKEKIENETKEKIEKLKENNEIINKFNELAEKFQKDCDELYLSQFTEEEKKEMLVNQTFDDSDMPLTRNHSYVADCCINLDFKPSEYFNLMIERSRELDKINELVKTVKAHVSIAKNKEEVEEILTRYDILDKKGRLKSE